MAPGLLCCLAALRRVMSSLHAEIFGEDSDEEEYVPPAHSTAMPSSAAAAAADEEDDDEGRVDQILNTQNNLLVSSKKAKEKKAREKSEKQGRGGKRKASAGIDAAIEKEKERKRRKELKKQRREAGEGGEGGEGGGEEGAGPSGAAGEDDPDSDSVSGDEAIEAGGKNDFERILGGLKHKRGGISFSREKLTHDVTELQRRMEEAAELDDEALKAEPPRPALAKVAMLNEVTGIIVKKQYHEVMIDHGMLSTLSRWLRPMHGGVLVSLEVRTGILSSLLRFDVDETVLGSLRSSQIGKFVKLLSLHKRETQNNRRVANQLIEKWSRPIFQTSDKVQAKDLPIADGPARPRAARLVEEDNPFAAASGPMTGNHARVPRPMGMDFSMLPQSEARALASSKYAKESVKGKLSDRITNVKKKPSKQAMTLSVEGRTLDRI